MLTKDEIKKVANLARLELSEAEEAKYQEQLSAVLDYVEQLSEVDTDQVEITSQVTGLKNMLREDKVNDWDEDEREDALSLAPEFENHQYKVKKVL